jgi:hypothetical protein
MFLSSCLILRDNVFGAHEGLREQHQAETHVPFVSTICALYLDGVRPGHLGSGAYVHGLSHVAKEVDQVGTYSNSFSSRSNRERSVWD